MYGYPGMAGRIQLAENPRTQASARIKRASAKARADATRLVNRDLDELKAIYQRAADDIRQRIRDHQNPQGTVMLESLRSLRDDIDRRITELARLRDARLNAGMNANARVATEPFLGAAQINADLARVAHESVQFVQSFVAEDGLQLSDRLWRIDRGTREAIGGAIESAIIQGDSATRAAEEFLSRGQPVPADLVKKAQAANAAALQGIPGEAMMKGEMSAYHQAERVFRTEINRAHIETFRNSAFEHPDVIGTKFLLSPRHPKKDICDLHASVNRYGLGPGVYPKGRSPLPAHPNTLSYEEVVFNDEVTPEDRAGKEQPTDWLKNQSTRDQVDVLGLNKTWALQAGHLKNNQITTPWEVLKKRYARDGIEPPSGLSSVLVRQIPTKTTVTKAVSDALDVRGYKRVAKHVLGAVDGVHNDGVLPVIPMQTSQSRKWMGVYERTKFTDQAVRIAISSAGDHKELTLVHELGHFIDHKGLPGAGMSSISSDKLDAWRKAALASDEVGQLEQAKKTAANYKKIKHLNYLLRHQEIWARSYAQWVTLRSGDAILTQQLAHILKTQSFANHWTDKSFEPIAKEIDQLFESLGWLKKKTRN